MNAAILYSNCDNGILFALKQFIYIKEKRHFVFQMIFSGTKIILWDLLINIWIKVNWLLHHNTVQRLALVSSNNLLYEQKHTNGNSKCCTFIISRLASFFVFFFVIVLCLVFSNFAKIVADIYRCRSREKIVIITTKRHSGRIHSRRFSQSGTKLHFVIADAILILFKLVSPI